MAIFKKKDDNGDESPSPEIEKLKETVQEAHLPEQVETVAHKEIEKLAKTSPAAAEYTIGMNYIDYLLTLPWNRKTDDNLDIRRAESILNEEHYGLVEIKDRILEYLAVRILKHSRKHRILVVDDEKMTRLNLEHVLSKDGYLVETAANGEEALRLMDQGAFDLIITDLKMEKVDGMGVLERARHCDPSPDVIIITGYATVSSAVEAIQKGSYQYLPKPFKLNDIRQTVANALTRKSARLAARGPVLCLAGPPGTGKTSLGLSIARSLEKKFIRISLAGVKDEAEIRGHRRSYVGAMPGRIIQEIRRAGSSNPVFMLDELDKLGQDFKGDPASALLEVLDPEQNTNFFDHYLDVGFDLSEVMFITTANTVDRIPGPLYDRLEVLNLSGYTEGEKEHIAFSYLIPRAIKEAGLVRNQVIFDVDAVHSVIREYTREAGLRNLQRQIDSICRKVARMQLESRSDDNAPVRISPEVVRQFLGPRQFHFEVAEEKERVGVVTGLAWTEAGGEIIQVEATRMKGHGSLMLTGSLGEVMKESAQAALSYIRSNTGNFNIPDDFFDTTDLHIHVPAGAIPKDGPSAGLTIAIALISLLTGRPAKRDHALTGELTLSGRVLPVGGIKDKVLAAHRAGIRTVVFPAKNEPDVGSIPEEVRNEIRILLVNDLNEIVDEVLR